MTTTVLKTKIREIENKIPDNSKHNTTQKSKKLTVENFAGRLKQADLVNKTDFDKKMTSISRPFTSNKTKYLEVQKKLSSPITKDYNFFLGRIYFTRNDRSLNTFAYQPTLDALELKKEKCTDYVLTWKSKGVFISKLKPFILPSCTTKFSKYKTGMKFDKDLLSIEQDNYLTKIVNVYIVYHLYT